MLTKQDKIAILNKLHLKKEKTLQKIDRYKEMSAPVSPENAIGRVSRMDAINSKSIVESALLEAENTLERLNQIEKIIDRDNYGACARCGLQIQLERLLIMPETAYCTRCA